MSLEVIKPGLFTTVQDSGRYGYQKYGVVVSGAMDSFALRTANLLVGNSEQKPGLEITLPGFTMKCLENAWIAICGAHLSPTLDGEEVPQWRPIYIEKGSVLTFKKVIWGCRAYLAVAGGIDIPFVMGSGSTYVRGGFGGFHGRALVQGDVLKFGQTLELPRDPDEVLLNKAFKPYIAAPWFVSGDVLPRYGLNSKVRIMRGKEFDLFSGQSQQELFNANFVVDPQSDRMGYKLTGSPIQLTQPYEMISEAVTAGTIQVPPEGNPVVLLADRQTTGGYPRIAQVAAVDLPVVAQLKPGDPFQFEEITHQEAEKLYLEREGNIEQLKQGIRCKWKGMLRV